MTTSRSSAFIVLSLAIVPLGIFTLHEFSDFAPYDFLYPIALIISMTGAALFFLGLFGRGFILGPFFILGTFISALGLVEVIFDYIVPCWLCLPYHPEFGEAAILAGAGLIAVNAFSWYSGIWPSYIEHRITKRVTARLIGILSAVDGAILFVFGWIAFADLGSLVEPQSVFWVQVAIGLLLMPLGLWIVDWSSKDRTQGSPSKTRFE